MNRHPRSRAPIVLLTLLVTACGDAPPSKEPRALGPEPEHPDELAGRWRVSRAAREAHRDRLAAEIEKLEAIGYAAGTEEAEDRTGVTLHDRERAWAGLNLYVSGHGPEALLVDMDGELLHRWRCSWDEAHATASESENDAFYRDFWRRAHLFDDGGLLAIFEGQAMVRLDVDSNLLWTFDGRPHHDLFVHEGHVFVLTREGKLLPRINEAEPVLEDFVTELDANGTELRRVSVLEAFERSEFAGFLENMPDKGDILHTNALERVDERLARRLPGVEVGNVLVSCLFLDTIAIIDLEAGQVVWALAKGWRWQHQPTVLDSGNMLVFDNRGADPSKGETRVIELDPVTEEFTWVYEGDSTNRLETKTCGSNQRLPNGNTLITESDNGRAIEVTPDKEIVWEFLNPHRAGKNEHLVATLFEVVRLPSEAVAGWLER